MNDIKLKPCPFCVGKAVLEYSGVEVLRNCERGNIEMAWKVWCPNCGTEKRGGLTTYWLNNDATLTIAREYDGRKKAIVSWNTRVAPHHNANTETCVCCGAEIPEGRQVCPACENGEDK